MNVSSAQLGMGSAIEKGPGGHHRRRHGIPGALVAGLALGLAEVFAVQYVGRVGAT
jgi:branched-chain amino acid transport system permease protein